MDALPRDVLVQILSQLPVQDVISISQVSRGMLEASQDDRVWVRREEWRMISVPQRAVGKWVGTVLGLPWQVIARCMRIWAGRPYDENDVIRDDANPNLTRRCILPCSVYVDFTRHGPMGALEMSRWRMVTNNRVCQEILKDRTKNPDATEYALQKFFVDVFRESGLPWVADEMPSPEYDSEFDSEYQCDSPEYDSDGEVVIGNDWYDYIWQSRTEERPPPRKQGYKGFGFRNVAWPSSLIFELTPRFLVTASLMTRMDATLFDDASDGANSTTPPWSRKIEETRKYNSGWTCWASQVLRPPNPKTEWSLLRARIVGVSMKAMHKVQTPPFDALSLDQLPWGPAVRIVMQTVQKCPNESSDNVDDPQRASAWPSLVQGPLPGADAERKRRRSTEEKSSNMRGFTVGGCKHKPSRNVPLSVRGFVKMMSSNCRQLFDDQILRDPDSHPTDKDWKHDVIRRRVFELENLVFKGWNSETHDYSSETAALVSLVIISRGFRHENVNMGDYESGTPDDSMFDALFIFYELSERYRHGRAEGADEAEEIVNTLRRDDEYIPIERWDERHALMLAETFPKYLLRARTACDPCMLAFAVEQLAASWHTWQWRRDKPKHIPPSELADRIRELMERRTYEAMRLGLTLLGVLE